MKKATPLSPGKVKVLPSGHRLGAIRVAPYDQDPPRFTYEVRSVDAEIVFLRGADSYLLPQDARRAGKRAFEKNRTLIFEKDPPRPQPAGRGNERRRALNPRKRLPERLGPLAPSDLQPE